MRLLFIVLFFTTQLQASLDIEGGYSLAEDVFPQINGKPSGCNSFLVGPRVVLTAAHCRVERN